MSTLIIDIKELEKGFLVMCSYSSVGVYCSQFSVVENKVKAILKDYKEECD